MSETAHNPNVGGQSQPNWLLGGAVWAIAVIGLSMIARFGDLFRVNSPVLEMLPLLFIGPSTVIAAILNDMMPAVPIIFSLSPILASFWSRLEFVSLSDIGIGD